MENGRTAYVKKNIFYGYIGTIATSFFQIICRTVFVYKLGVSYLGISGLFTNILGVLSFTELGIGSAIIFSLYKPIAENDTEKIKSLLQLYKQAYKIIGCIVLVAGLAISFFLESLINSELPIQQIKIYYYIFLFNTVTSYFLTYKNSYATAIQKEYIVSNIHSIGIIITNILQIVVLLLGGKYLFYLLIIAFVELMQKIATLFYLNKHFPILTEKNIKPLDRETKTSIWKNVRALIVHKIADVSVHQSDNIIISAFISTYTVGLLSNYTTLNNVISLFTTKFFKGFTASLGNLITKENLAKQNEIFDIYDLLGFWIYGFVFIAFTTLAQPFITLWLGKGLLIDNTTIFLYFFAEYLAGMSFILYNFKIAAGIFNEDKYVALIQAIVNIVVSIISAKKIGLPGVFIGTLVSRMIAIIARPLIVYKYVLKKRSIMYFIRLILRTLLAISLSFCMHKIGQFSLFNSVILNFILLCLLTFIIPNTIFFLIFRKTKEFNEIIHRLRKK